MKIAYIYTAILEYGGVDRILTMKANYLAEELGHEVYVITDSQHGLPTTFPLSPKVKHIDLGINFDQEYQYNLLKRYFVYKRLMKRYKKALSELFDKLKLDIVCTTCGRDLDFLTTLKDGSKKVGESHIAKEYFRNFHLMERKGFPYNLVARHWRRKQERAIKALDAFVVLTDADAANWAPIATANVIANPYTIEPPTVSTCKNKRIISVGRLASQKSYERLIEAWSMIADRHPDWRLDIYGEGELIDYLTSEIKRRGVENSLHINAPTKQIADKYIESSFFVMSSRFEGLPLVLLEAMRCGLPCVSFDCPHGPRELIRDGSNGLLIENGNIGALAKAMERLIDDERLRQKMGAAAREYSNLYSMPATMAKWETLFEGLLNSKRILFLVYHGFSEYSGISKKIQYQVKGLRELGHTVYLCTYDFDERGHRVRNIDGQPIQDYGTGKKAALCSKLHFSSLLDFIDRNHIKFVYARSFHNANPFTIRLFKQLEKRGIPSVIEIPTYPYDQEYNGAELKYRMELQIDKIFRHALAKHTSAIVSFTDNKEIFGQRVINISNGIDFDDIPLRKTDGKTSDEVHFLSVAEVHYWHGFDRFIAGIGEYYKNGGKRKIVYHIVGGIAPADLEDNSHAPGFNALIRRYGIQDHVVFHGVQFGEQLNEFFDKCQFAVGSLARHRSGITTIKTLKNREYAVRGIPFIYSETDSDFEDMPYILKAPADESPINIQQVLDFYDNLKISAEEIRQSVTSLSWKNQMKRVMDNF